MKLEFQRGLILVYLQETLLYIFCVKSCSDSIKIYSRFRHQYYNLVYIDLKDFEKIDRTIFKIYDYHKEID